jgi:hypothetical protein
MGAIAILPDTRSVITSNICWAIYNSILRHHAEPQPLRNGQLIEQPPAGASHFNV